MDRDYVVVCNRHKGIAGSLLFWGCLTKDYEQRSFGGYTSNFDTCEIYTLEEAQNNDYKFPLYEGNKSNLKKFDDFIIRIDQLEELGHRPMLIYYR